MTIESGSVPPSDAPMQPRTGFDEKDISRFWSKVNKNGPTPNRPSVRLKVPSECWVWMTGSDKKGYGKFSIAGKHKLAHRVSYEIMVGAIPEGFHIDHLCGYHNCVNPAHLEAVTPEENILRSFGPSGIPMGMTTHCPKGHPLSGENRRRDAFMSSHLCRECYYSVGEVPFSEVRDNVESLVLDKNPRIRAQLAANPVLTEFPQIMEVLSNDDDERTRINLATNLAIGGRLGIIQILAKDGSWAVRSNLARNPSVAEFSNITDSLALDKNPRVRASLAANPVNTHVSR